MNTRSIIFPSNKVCDIERTFFLRLAPLYDAEEIRNFFLMLCEKFVGWNTADYLLHRNGTINQSELLRFHWALDSLMQSIPIQHIIGHVSFCGCDIRVSPDVLIPRPETEEWTDRLIRTLSPTPKTAADICTGSGCIACAIAKAWPATEVTAMDISEAALSIAKDNALRNDVTIDFRHDDILSPTLSYGSYDLIVSNPPYVRESERASMHPNVLGHEPELALFVSDDDPLIFYRAAATFAAKHLALQGKLVLEINQYLVDETLRLLDNYGFRGEVRQDFRGNDRLVIVSFSNQ